MHDMSEIGWMRARLALGIPCGTRPHFRLPGSPKRGETAAVDRTDVAGTPEIGSPEVGRTEVDYAGGRLRFDPPHVAPPRDILPTHAAHSPEAVPAQEVPIEDFPPAHVPRERPARNPSTKETFADAALGQALAGLLADVVRHGSAEIALEREAEPEGMRSAGPEMPPPGASHAAEKPSFTVAFGSGATYDLQSPAVPSEGLAPVGSATAPHPRTPVGLFADARAAMQYQNGNAQFEAWLDLALRMNAALGADALMLLADGILDFDRLRKQAKESKLLLGLDTEEQVEQATAAGFPAVALGMEERPVHERISLALLACVADDVLKPGARVVVLYSGYEADKVDSLSVINLGEHLERLSASDLQKLEMRIPLDTLKKVVDLALEIGREGREGKPVGTIFVVGDHRKVLENSRSAGFDPVRGYSRRERNLHDRRVREGIKEVAQLDGAFVITADGHVAAACRILDGSSTGLTLPKGLGARHWAAAAITKVCKGVAVAVSESSGTVRLFQNGELMLRIEPFRRPMKWKDFHYEPPTPEPEKVKRERPAVD